MEITSEQKKARMQQFYDDWVEPMLDIMPLSMLEKVALMVEKYSLIGDAVGERSQMITHLKKKANGVCCCIFNNRICSSCTAFHILLETEKWKKTKLH